jgi:mono/diheme cytochrome c family protein
MSRRVRLLLIPAILFTVVSAAVYSLAQTHPAKDEAASAPLGAPVAADSGNGERLFAEKCASCHGEGGTGGGVGPRLAGSGISQDAARARIQTGSGVMPADLVEGQDLEDVLAYLKTIAR